ncbi:MAG TPA: DMT family transporter [Acidimicrobiia bacterium]|nr:DMT family transporter [Acidimicrobiia bacterium]
MGTHRRARALALLVTFLWSSSWILIRWGLDDEALAPITFAALRYGLAFLALFALVAGRSIYRRQVKSLDAGAWREVALLGVVFYTFTQAAQFVAINNQPAATSSLVLSLTPLLVAATATWSLSEKPHRSQITGAVLVALGAWSYFSGQLGTTVVGMTAAFVSLAGNAASTLLGRRVNRETTVSPLVVTALSMAIGSLLLVVLGIGVEGVPEVSGRAWAIIIWLAVVNTAFAFTLWNRSLRRLSAVESAGINNTMLIQIALLAWLFLDEAPRLMEWIGILAVSLGIFLTQASGSGIRSVVQRPFQPTDELGQ